MAPQFRESLDQFVMLLGVAILVALVTLMSESLWPILIVLIGMSLIAIGVWRLASQLLPDRRIYVDLRDEVERFIDLVRKLNAHSLEGNAALKEDAHAAMRESVDRMFELAGRPQAEE